MYAKGRESCGCQLSIDSKDWRHTSSSVHIICMKVSSSTGPYSKQLYVFQPVQGFRHWVWTGMMRMGRRVLGGGGGAEIHLCVKHAREVHAYGRLCRAVSTTWRAPRDSKSQCRRRRWTSEEECQFRCLHSTEPVGGVGGTRVCMSMSEFVAVRSTCTSARKLGSSLIDWFVAKWQGAVVNSTECTHVEVHV